MKFAITGGSGFIGSNIAKSLCQKHDVIVIDNLERGTLENLSDISAKIDFHKVDILDYEKLEPILENVDGVFHQAGLGSVPQSFEDPEKYLQVNAIGTENILKTAKKFGFKVVFASSSSVYGDQKVFPINESAPKNPLNPYGESKLQAEKFAKQYANDGVKVIGLRYFNVFGIGQNPNYAGVIPKFISQLKKNQSPVIEGDGTQIRNFTFVDDIVNANLLAFHSNVTFGFFNIATGIKTSINELAKILIELYGLKLEPIYVKPREGDIKISQADITLAKNKLGWEPKVSLKDGLLEILPKFTKQEN